MDKLCKAIERELEALEDEVAKNGITEKTAAYMDKLTHTLKSLKTVEAMDGYSEDYTGSYARRRDSMGLYTKSYSRDAFADRLESLMNEAPDEETRQKMRRMLDGMR